MTKNRQIITIGVIGFLILIASFIFVDASTFAWNNWLNRILTSISLILITIVVIDLVWNLLGGDPQEKLMEKLNNSVNLLAHSKDSGLVDFCTVSGSFAKHTDWIKMLIDTKHELDLMGYSLRSWTYGENFSGEIIRLAKRNVKIRIMIMDENNQNLEAMNNPNIYSYSTAQLKEEIISFEKIFQKINADLKSFPNKPKFKKVNKGVITAQLCRFDSRIVVTPYLYSVQTSESPLYLVDGKATDLYQKYTKEFDSLWNQ
ncbi:hypothetical protein FACS18948_7350 [Clostridia bacterium]|nr:hypothetical protein FACS18948_7350 [Clostridia bacterium]